MWNGLRTAAATQEQQDQEEEKETEMINVSSVEKEVIGQEIATDTEQEEAFVAVVLEAEKDIQEEEEVDLEVDLVVLVEREEDLEVEVVPAVPRRLNEVKVILLVVLVVPKGQEVRVLPKKRHQKERLLHPPGHLQPRTRENSVDIAPLLMNTE